jgi:hypothetical protein
VSWYNQEISNDNLGCGQPCSRHYWRCKVIEGMRFCKKSWTFFVSDKEINRPKELNDNNTIINIHSF